MDYRPGDSVRIKRLRPTYCFVQDAANRRAPTAGDRAEVTAVYAGPPRGYALTCCDYRGRLIWRMRFQAADIELEPGAAPLTRRR